MTNQTTADYDSPWKEAIDQYFEAFVEFFFPEAHSQIDWARGYEFMDTELQQVVRDGELGRRLADKLVKVWRYDGTLTLVLVHIEVQSQMEAGFAERIYVYNYRIFDRYRLPVATLVVLADEQASWRPDNYGYEVFGCRMSLQFPIVKLLDYESQWESLQTNPNPFAVLVMAHLKSQATRRKPTERLQWKLSLVKSLYQRGYNRQDILELARLIDWMMTLPVELEQGFQLEMKNYEEGNKMPYVTSWERLGITQSRREDVLEILETRFGMVPDSIGATINQIQDTELLKTLHKRAITIGSNAEFENLCQQLLAGGESS